MLPRPPLLPTRVQHSMPAKRPVFSMDIASAAALRGLIRRAWSRMLGVKDTRAALSACSTPTPVGAIRGQAPLSHARYSCRFLAPNYPIVPPLAVNRSTNVQSAKTGLDETRTNRDPTGGSP
ncbi:hypothetical protein FRC12_004686 [Ceratobasidium sp. 428]|nr:hypothetical protein FRC12_004686 [Ceratobasidium sp. 428]